MSITIPSPFEFAGATLGWVVGPLFALTSALRRARTFHPSGDVYSAEVTPLGDSPLGATLRGPALVRFSSALWKAPSERADVLGCAVRFCHASTATPVASADDQDLLFATISRPWTLLVAPLHTNVHDYLCNDYSAVSPFDVPGLGRAYLRLRPISPSGTAAGTRTERLLRDVARGDAALQLEVRRTWHTHWLPVARVTLRAPVDIDQDRLRFWPFRTGRGIVPRGAVHALRHGVYTLSQWGRP